MSFVMLPEGVFSRSQQAFRLLPRHTERVLGSANPVA
jgi:hypothetical protein